MTTTEIKNMLNERIEKVAARIVKDASENGFTVDPDDVRNTLLEAIDELFETGADNVTVMLRLGNDGDEMVVTIGLELEQLKDAAAIDA